MAEHYQDFHRYLLQWFMARKLVTEQDAKQMFRKTCEIYDSNHLSSVDRSDLFYSIYNMWLVCIICKAW